MRYLNSSMRPSTSMPFTFICAKENPVEVGGSRTVCKSESILILESLSLPLKHQNQYPPSHFYPTHI